MTSTDFFGIDSQYFHDSEFFSNLSEKIKINKFENYSKSGISSYFSFRYPILNNTMFDGYQACNTPWRPKFSYNNDSFDIATAKTEELLIEAVRKIIDNHNIIGVTLSGGLDSSLIAAIIKNVFPKKKLYTYSCGFYGNDEFEYSRKVAKLFSDKHTEFILGKDDFVGENSILPALIEHKAAPLHPNELGLAIAEQKAKLDHCDIVLCGEGADDVFGGYGKNLRMYLDYQGDTKDFYKFIMKNYSYFSPEEMKKLLNDDFYTDTTEMLAPVFKEQECPTDIKDVMFYFIQRVHTRGLIERGSNALNFNSFQQGFPFIDPDLVEYGNSLCFDYKVHWNEGVKPEKLDVPYTEVSEKYDTPKFILKRVAEKYLPNDIIYRKKIGFPVPFELWFKNDKQWDLDSNIFKTNDISSFSGWKKFMIINLDTFIKIFNKYKN